MAKECLYCGLRFPETTTFCPDCGRPTASGFKIRPTQEFEVDSLRREIMEKDELIRRLALFRTRRREVSRAQLTRLVDAVSTAAMVERKR
jgi:hypothetical protein